MYINTVLYRYMFRHHLRLPQKLYTKIKSQLLYKRSQKKFTLYYSIFAIDVNHLAFKTVFLNV
jgi:hypothetical protein